MGKKKVGSKKPVVEKPTLEEEVDQLLNPKFTAMKAAAKSFPAPVTQEKHIAELADWGMIQSKDLANWSAPGEHRVPVS